MEEPKRKCAVLLGNRVMDPVHGRHAACLRQCAEIVGAISLPRPSRLTRWRKLMFKNPGRILGNVLAYRGFLAARRAEAAAMELPVVATRVTGSVDAVVDGVTGTLVPPRDAAALAEALRRYLLDPGLRRKHGSAGRERVVREFQPERIWEALYREYVELLQKRGLPTPSRD
jgi:glycosyltransferase involved in cell wall biosynthesis